MRRSLLRRQHVCRPLVLVPASIRQFLPGGREFDRPPTSPGEVDDDLRVLGLRERGGVVHLAREAAGVDRKVQVSPRPRARLVLIQRGVGVALPDQVRQRLQVRNGVAAVPADNWVLQQQDHGRGGDGGGGGGR